MAAIKTSTFRKTLDRATDVALILSMILLAALVLTYLYEVASRYFFNLPQQWPSNLEPALFCVGTFLALPAVTRWGEHISIDIVPSAIPQRWKWLMSTVLVALAGVVCLTLTYVCGSEVINQIASGASTYGSLPYPKWLVTISLPFGFGTMTLHFFLQALDHAASRKAGQK